MTESHPKNALFARSSDVARGIVAAIDHGKAEVYVPGFWRYIVFIVRNLPEALFQRVGSISGR